MCKNCIDMKVLRQCSKSCYCNGCRYDEHYCYDWLYEPKKTPPADPQVDATFASMLDKINLKS